MCLTNNYDAIAGSVENKDGSYPSIDIVMGDLAKAIWILVNYSEPHSPDNIWGAMCGGYVSGISPNAKWIWGSSMNQYDNYGDYQIFRTQIGGGAATPEEEDDDASPSTESNGSDSSDGGGGSDGRCFINTIGSAKNAMPLWPSLLCLAGALLARRRKIS